MGSRKMRCSKCNETDQCRISHVRIDEFPQVMEMRMEFQSEALQNAIGWRDMRVPRYLIWAGIRYEFEGMILRNPTKNSEHFSSYVVIGHKLYFHADDQEGLLRLSNTRIDPNGDFCLSTAIPEGSKIVPSRFYYLKDDKTKDGEWTKVQFECRPTMTKRAVEPDKEPDSSRNMDVDDPQDNCMFCTPETAPPGENLEWIQCNGCKRWAHILCISLSPSIEIPAIEIPAIDKFHCKRCEKTRGPTTCSQYSGKLLKIDRPPPRKSEQVYLNVDYASLNLGDITNLLRNKYVYNAFFKDDAPRKFAADRFKRMEGWELTKEWAEKTGCNEPVVIPKGHSDGMGMTMPVDLTVRKVAELVGEDTRVEVIGTTPLEVVVNVDVLTQTEVPNWRLKQWADYYDTPADQRDRVRNVM